MKVGRGSGRALVVGHGATHHGCRDEEGHGHRELGPLGPRDPTQHKVERRGHDLHIIRVRLEHTKIKIKVKGQKVPACRIHNPEGDLTKALCASPSESALLSSRVSNERKLVGRSVPGNAGSETYAENVEDDDPRPLAVVCNDEQAQGPAYSVAAEG